MNAPDALYVHIPFCASICGYCDFPKVLYRQAWAEDYLSALFCELKAKKIGKVSTIYVGGGTPTALSPDELISLLAKLSPLLKEGGEFTVEGNPDSIDEIKAGILSRFGVNRVSLGLQSTHAGLLETMGRTHTFEDAKRAVSLLRDAGIENINLDLIYALPGESVAMAVEDAKNAASLGVPHLSCYSLILEEGTSFSKKGLQEASQEDAADQYEAILRTLRSLGYARYEVSNFAKPGFESRHNKVYWKDEPYYAIGLGAAYYVDGIRGKNTRSLSLYKKGKTVEEEERISPEEDRDYFLMTNLRLAEGFSLMAFEKRFGTAAVEELLRNAKDPKLQGILEIDGDRFRPTDRGILLLDTILVNL